MPVSIRTLAPNFSAAGYRFPPAQVNPGVEKWPWLRVPISNTELCNTCSRLNFRWLFRESLAGFTVSDGVSTSVLSDGIFLGSYADVVSRSPCPLCQLIIYALYEGADIDMLNDYDDWPRQEIWLRNHSLNSSGKVVNFEDQKDEYIVRLDVHLKANTQENLLFSSRGPGGRTVTIQEIQATPNGSLVSSYVGRGVDQDSKGLVRTIQRWIRPCLDNFDSTLRSLQRQGGASVRLIDTQDACIVRPKPNERYVALSYTWGKIDPLVLLECNEPELRKTGALIKYKSRLPVTIQDSITLCKMLGERYLWVDSLCIMQDTTDKHDQIQQMDKIYQEAMLCIVAAAGRDANAGLPGVSRQRDVRQRIIEIEGMALANTVPDIVSSVTSTFWRSRGWCFQESLLSSRKLIFTPDQTFFHCPHGQCNEDTHCFTHNSLILATNQGSLGLNIDDMSNWRIYKNVVADYSSCELSFEADMLNAFAGIASFLRKSVFLGCPLVMGIPFCSLEVGLLWYPSTKLRRRSGTGLPSWSWVGWVGMIDYADENENIFERTISRIQWDLDEGSGESQEFMTCVPPRSWDGWKDWKRIVVGELNEVHYVHVDLPPTRWFSHPIPQQHWPIRSKTSLLKCTAEIATLVITGEHADHWYQTCTEDEHDVCHLQVFDDDGRRCGIVMMDGATFEQTSFSHTSFAFVKISQTTLTARDDPAWDEETKSLAGIAGERAINPRSPLDPSEEEFDQAEYDCNIGWCMYNVLVVKFDSDVARRIAVGRVHITAFDKSPLERKNIWLG